MTAHKDATALIEEWDALYQGIKEQLDIIVLYEDPLPDATADQLKQSSVRMHQIMQRLINRLGQA